MKLSLRLTLATAALALGAACAQDRNVAVADTSALALACADDCSKATSEPCFEGVCNSTTGTCEVMPSADGTTCDDGQFCTIGDSCQSGVCKAGAPNPCGTTDCLQGVCNEDLKSCALAARPDGLPCKTDGNLCISDAACQAGACIGTVNDCVFAAGVDECHQGTCDPKTGGCIIAPANDGAACHADGQCTDAQTCFKGKCQGGVSRTESWYSPDTTACHEMVCNSADGSLTEHTLPIGAECPFTQGSGYECLTGKCMTGGQCQQVIKVGAPCTAAADDCTIAACNTEAACTPTPANEGQACDDRDACTIAETCQAGNCKGVPRPGVEIYWREDFSDLAAGWRSAVDLNFGGPHFGVLSPSLLPLVENPFYPQRDHTATIDNQMLGLVGGNIGATMDSPVIDLSKASGQIVLTAWSALSHNDGASAAISVFDGTTWQPVWATPYASVSNDWVFYPIVVDISRYRIPNLRIRLEVVASDPLDYGTTTWFLDDFTIANRDCANNPVTPATGGNGE